MFKVLTEGCEPTRGSKYSACVDLYASEDVTICAGETKLVGLGVAIDEKFEFKTEDLVNQYIYTNDFSANSYSFASWFKSTHYLQLMLRSSLGKKGLILPNGVGIIDLDYRDEIKMIIHNPITLVDYDAEENAMVQYGGVDDRTYDQCDAKCALQYKINKGDRIAQITLMEHRGYLFGIDTDKERTGGFGSTGSK